MKLLRFGKEKSSKIENYDSVGAWAQPLGDGAGASHVYSVYLDSDSEIGPHPTGFCQLFLVTGGSGWVASADNRRVELAAGEGAFFEKGEVHSKGSDSGMHAIMIQVDRFTSI